MLDKIAKLKQAPASESFPKDQPKPETVIPVEAPSPEKPSKTPIDFSSIDPEKEWECFGTIDKNHPECKECPFADRCEDKKNSRMKK